MTDIDADALLPNDRVKQAVLAGDITQLTRGASNRYAEEGDTFDLEGERFEVTSVAPWATSPTRTPSARAPSRWRRTRRGWSECIPVTSSGTIRTRC